MVEFFGICSFLPGAMLARVIVTMKVTVVRPDELGASEEKLWREFQNSSPVVAHPSMSLAYARAVCRVDESGRVAVVEDGGEVCAFLPYSLEGDGIAATLGGTQTAVDGFVSSGAPIDMRAVIRRAGLRGWRFSRVPTGQHALAPYRYQGRYNEDLIYFSDLRAGYDAYVRGLPKGGRSDIASAARRRRAMEREIDSVRFEWHSGDPAHLPLLLRWKAEKFENFGNWLSSPANSAQVRELATTDDAGCSAVMSVLYAQDKVVSLILSLRRDRILSQWMAGYDHEYFRFSPGTNHMLAMFAAAPEHGVEIADFGYGRDQYKPRFASGVDTVGGGGVWASRLGGAARSLYRRVRFTGGE
jgi:CelD/BcsL family acetyltransferase involved in cellulose biosynthesis